MRILLIVTTALSWAFALWVASHVSSEPALLGRWSPSYFGVVAACIAAATLLTAAHAAPVYSRLFAVRHRLLALLLSAAGAVACIEVAARLLDPYGISYYEESRRYHLDKIADPELVYRHRPNVQRTYFGVRQEYNELGLRERPLDVRAPDELRVVVLGDSVVLGAAVQVEETFARVLEGRLRARLRRPVRTINAGVGSYNTTQEYLFLARHVDELDPDLVLLVYVHNDVELNLPPFDPRGETSLRGKSPPEVVQRVLWFSWTYRLAAHSARRSRIHSQLPDRRSEGWRESMSRIGDVADFCAERGVPLAVFLWRLRPTPLTDALWEDLAELARARAFALGDLGRAFRDEDPRGVSVSTIDAHPNARGHRLAAAMIDEFLAAQVALEMR